MIDHFVDMYNDRLLYLYTFLSFYVSFECKRMAIELRTHVWLGETNNTPAAFKSFVRTIDEHRQIRLTMPLI